MAESTPLLDDINENTPHIDNNIDETEIQADLPVEKTPASAHFKRIIRILVIINLIVSAVTVALLVANYIILRHAPLDSYYYYSWNALEASKSLGIFMFVSLVFSVINVLVNFPILLNIIVDVVLASGIIAWVVHLLSALANSSWCQVRYTYPRPGNPNPEPIYPHPKCKDWKLVVTILMSIAAGFGIIVAAIYLGLLLLRTIAIFRTKFWKRPVAWTFPTGQITLEITLKLLKQESANQSAEAGPAPAHGPLYL